MQTHFSCRRRTSIHVLIQCHTQQSIAAFSSGNSLKGSGSSLHHESSFRALLLEQVAIFQALLCRRDHSYTGKEGYTIMTSAVSVKFQLSISSHNIRRKAALPQHGQVTSRNSHRAKWHKPQAAFCQSYRLGSELSE